LASQWVTVAKICGAAGQQALARFTEWDAARVPDAGEPTLFDHAQWPQDIRDRADEFVRHLADRASDPPVLFYCRYVDYWSMGDIFENVPGVVPLVIFTSHRTLYCFDLAASLDLLENLGRTLRRRAVSQEYRWYALFLREAIHAWNDVAEEGALIVVREPLGGLVEDGEVVTSLEIVPAWL
jgi:hypothetical protein